MPGDNHRLQSKASTATAITNSPMNRIMIVPSLGRTFRNGRGPAG
jgi:hypothetical protein